MTPFTLPFTLLTLLLQVARVQASSCATFETGCCAPTELLGDPPNWVQLLPGDWFPPGYWFPPKVGGLQCPYYSSYLLGIRETGPLYSSYPCPFGLWFSCSITCCPSHDYDPTPTIGGYNASQHTPPPPPAQFSPNYLCPILEGARGFCDGVGVVNNAINAACLPTDLLQDAEEGQGLKRVKDLGDAFVEQAKEHPWITTGEALAAGTVAAFAIIEGPAGAAEVVEAGEAVQQWCETSEPLRKAIELAHQACEHTINVGRLVDGGNEALKSALAGKFPKGSLNPEMEEVMKDIGCPSSGKKEKRSRFERTPAAKPQRRSLNLRRDAPRNLCSEGLALIPDGVCDLSTSMAAAAAACYNVSGTSDLYNAGFDQDAADNLQTVCAFLAYTGFPLPTSSNAILCNARTALETLEPDCAVCDKGLVLVNGSCVVPSSTSLSSSTRQATSSSSRSKVPSSSSPGSFPTSSSTHISTTSSSGLLSTSKATSTTRTSTTASTVPTSPAFPSAGDYALNASSTSTSATVAGPHQATHDGSTATEWISNNQTTGAALVLSWPVAVQISSIVLYDRKDLLNQITGGTIYFSDKSTVSFGALNNDGSATSIPLSKTVTTTSVLVSITKVSSTTTAVGLSEVAVYGPYPYSSYLTASSSHTSPATTTSKPTSTSVRTTSGTLPSSTSISRSILTSSGSSLSTSPGGQTTTAGTLKSSSSSSSSSSKTSTSIATKTSSTGLQATSSTKSTTTQSSKSGSSSSFPKSSATSTFSSALPASTLSSTACAGGQNLFAVQNNYCTCNMVSNLFNMGLHTKDFKVCNWPANAFGVCTSSSVPTATCSFRCKAGYVASSDGVSCVKPS